MSESPSRNSLYFSLLCTIVLVPLWVVEYPPLIDYPNHLARAFILTHLGDPNFHFKEFYAADWGLYPYVSTDVILVGLQQVLPIDVAGRVFLSLCVLSVPVGCWFFIREANPTSKEFAYWPFLISYNPFFFYGWINTELSLGLCFLALGLWLRYLSRPKPHLWLLALFVITALYFTHLIGFGVAGLAVLLYSLCGPRRVKDLLISWALFLPGGLFYLWSRLGPERNWTVEFSGPLGKVVGLTSVLRGYSTFLDVVTLIVLAACAVGGCWRNSDLRRNTRWLTIAAVLFGLYWIFPASFAGGAEADRRLMPFVVVLGLASVSIGPRARRLVPVAVLLLGLRVANVTTNFLAAQPELSRMAQAFEVTPPGARVLPIVEARHDRSIQRAYFMFWAYGVIKRGWYSPYLFHLRGVQPLRITVETYRPPGFWPLEYKESPDWFRVQRDYDYVWLFNVDRFGPDLSKFGEVVFNGGDLRVFRLNRGVGGSPPP